MENDAKKLKVVGTVLKNMGVGSRSASRVAVPGVDRVLRVVQEAAP